MMRGMTGRRVLLLVGPALVAMTLLTGCPDSSPPSNPAVISRINSETDCSELQGEFDRAEANHHTDYMQAADRRMRTIGCYDR
jgi:hypothetical protein